MAQCLSEHSSIFVVFFVACRLQAPPWWFVAGTGLLVFPIVWRAFYTAFASFLAARLEVRTRKTARRAVRAAFKGSLRRVRAGCCGTWVPVFFFFFFLICRVAAGACVLCVCARARACAIGTL